MDYQVIWAESAASDFQEIVAYINSQSPAVAERFQWAWFATWKYFNRFL